MIDAIRAIEAAGFTEQADFYWALHATFVARPEERLIFAQVFRLFWRDPRYLEHMMSMLLPAIRGVSAEAPAEAAARRAAEALLDGTSPPMPAHMDGDDSSEIEIDATATASAEEQLRRLDFEQMSPDEMAAARRMIARLKLPIKPLISRRSRSSVMGREPDWRKSFRDILRLGGEMRGFATKQQLERWPNLVVLCDISGSMSAYSRMALHFVHAVANEKGAGWAGVHAFTFGTRLTNITRHLRGRDVDAALAAAGAEAQDWQGGTRIGSCLHAFNRDWSRCVMGQGAVVVLITDGLDCDETTDLGAEVARLRRSCRRLIWLNPLLRWDGFAPRAQGIAAMLPHVDALRAGHSVASLEALGAALSLPEDGGEKARLLAMLRR